MKDKSSLTCGSKYSSNDHKRKKEPKKTEAKLDKYFSNFGFLRFII